MNKSVVHVPNRSSAARLSKPTMSDLYLWMPELVVMVIFLVAVMVADGVVSLISLLLAAASAGWIIVSRARTARRNARVLAEYDADLAAADARALADTYEDRA